MNPSKTGANDADDDGGPLSAVTKGFDQYEYIAIIVPGIAFLFGFMIARSGRLPFVFDKDFSLGAFGIFLIAAYVIGQLIHCIGEFVGRIFWRCFGGQPTEWVLSDRHKLLDEEQRKKLADGVKWLLALTRDVNLATEYGSKRGEWQAVTRRIYAKVNQAGRSVRIDAFNRTDGMMIGLVIALVATAVLFGIDVYRIGTLCSRPALYGACALILAFFALCQYYSFGKSYGRELFVEFIELPKK